ncbi:MAG TPA: hypothetical protein VK348_01970 [Planctomycetota bacterium]|nr:hypothetical protein [Planctomycetota bacterium]
MLRRGGGISSGTNVLVLDRATTGDDGSGVLHAAPDTPALVVIAEGDHCVATMVRDVKLPRAGNSLRVEVAAACILRGTVRPLTFVRRFGPSEEVLAIDAVSLPNATRFAYQYPTIDLRRIGEQQPAATTRLKADGTFQFVAIPPGSYEVWLGPIASSGKASAVSSVDLRAGETKSIDVDVSQYVPGHLVGHFFVDGTAWQGEVDFHLIDGRTNQALTDASGTATSTWLLPGRYLPCAVVQEGDFGRYILGTEPIVLAPGAQLEFTAMLHRRRVVVTMHYSDDQPVASRLFVLEPLDHPEFAFSFQYGNRTNEHGELILDPAPPGRLRIRAFAADQDMFKDTPALVLGEVSADATELTLQLPR